MSENLNLLVICEPNYITDSQKTRNRSTNEILIEYSKYFNEVHCLCPGDITTYDLPSSINIKFHTIDNYRGNKFKKTFYLLKSNRQFLLKLISKYEIDIIQFRIPSTFSMSLYNDIKDIRIIKTVYIAGDIYLNMVNTFSKFPFIKTIARFFERLQSNLIRDAIAVCTGDVLKQKYFHINSNIHAYYSTTHVNIIKSDNLRNQEPFGISFVGRIDNNKRLNDLIDALSILNEKRVIFKLYILGQGSELILEDLKMQIDKLNLIENVDFCGYVSNKEILDKYLLRSTALVLPSITEGTAKVLPEAMSRGVIPIAVKGAGSNNFIIKDGINGFLVNPKSPDEIASSLLKLYKDKELVNKIQKKCYEYAESMTMNQQIKLLWNFVLKNYIYEKNSKSY